MAEVLAHALPTHIEDLSETVIFVNTTRMRRRVVEAFQNGPARVLPHVRLITDLGLEATQANIPPPVSALRQRLSLFPLVKRLIDSSDVTADRAAATAWSDSLAKLVEEMSGEGVTMDALLSLDVADHSGHWQKSLTFLKIIAPFLDGSSDMPDTQARLRMILADLATRWAKAPPQTPIIVAGSTGSRGVGHLFMELVAGLPQGAVVLPGFDFAMPTATWAALDDPFTAQDHPQYRFRRFLDTVGVAPSDVTRWGQQPSDEARNALISLSLRPAPITDQWRVDGPKLGDLIEATRKVTLVEASTPREEAETIALRLRQAAAENRTAALVTPDRTLTRQVTAALDQWDLIPDDSAGVPLALTASGRILRHVVQAMGQSLSADLVFVMLKHPLTHSGPGRGLHLLRTRRLELKLRRYGPPFLSQSDIEDWALKQAEQDPGCVEWGKWLSELITDLARDESGTLATVFDRHIALTEQLCEGVEGSGGGDLWAEREGREAQKAVQSLRREADALDEISLLDYRAVFDSVLAPASVRDPDAGDPRILIWGTLEARVGGADLIILGGMNEGIWPEASPADPWLNRQMRKDAGLLLPERQIGLSAHDYQLAMAASEVWVTRAKRSAEAETVPSRWVNRLTNLAEGLPEQSGPDAVRKMRERGTAWLTWAKDLSRPERSVDPEPRPAPRPPVSARPTSLSVTQIKTLIRDPYAIYAANVLRLRALNPLQAHADAPLRGIIYHRILERFVKANIDLATPQAFDALITIATEELRQTCPWPTVQLQWLSRFKDLAPGFLKTEAQRRQGVTRSLTEARGEMSLLADTFTLIARSDRIDVAQDGSARIYDYKTASSLPTRAQQLKFDKQLLLTAAMVERGAFDTVGQAVVSEAAFLSIHPALTVSAAPLIDAPPDKTLAEFEALMTQWRDPARGYSARLALFSTDDTGDYDTLSRFGEWGLADAATPVDLT